MTGPIFVNNNANREYSSIDINKLKNMEFGLSQQVMDLDQVGLEHANALVAMTTRDEQSQTALLHIRESIIWPNVVRVVNHPAYCKILPSCLTGWATLSKMFDVSRLFSARSLSAHLNLLQFVDLILSDALDQAELMVKGVASPFSDGFMEGLKNRPIRNGEKESRPWFFGERVSLLFQERRLLMSIMIVDADWRLEFGRSSKRYSSCSF
jgi:hypothetical protein